MRDCATGFALGTVLCASLLWPQPAAAERIEILVEDAFVPFSLKDGTGLSNEIVRAGFQAGGIDVKLQVFPFVRLMEMVKRGQAIGGFNAVPTPQTREECLFGAEPIFTTHMYFYYNVKQPIVIDTKEEITSKLLKTRVPVGQVRGYIYPDEYEQLKLGMTGQAELLVTVEHESDDGLIRMMKQGRVKSALMTAEVANYHIERLQWSSDFAHGDYKWEAPLFVCFSKSHPDAPRYAEVLDKGMREIRKNGAYAEITGRYSFLSDR